MAIKPLLQPLWDRELSGQAVLEEPEVVVLAAGKEDKMAVKVADREVVDPAVGKAAKTVVRIVVEVEAVKTMIKEAVVETVEVTRMAVEVGPRFWFSLLAL